jgi:hypothetical protein
MAQVYVERENANSFRLDSVLCAAFFIPCFTVWTIGVMCMLPITILAFSVQYFLSISQSYTEILSLPWSFWGQLMQSWPH